MSKSSYGEFTLFGSKFTRLATALVVLFTIVEVVTMVGWLAFALAALDTGSKLYSIIAIAILTVGLTVEHFISAATGSHITPVEKDPAEN